MATLISLLFLLFSLAAIIFTLGICRASRQADDLVRRIMDPRVKQETPA
ncbi:hypothetical protein KQI65_02965 [bacterium]|nr:hypothetical protein [bacterium]